MSATESSMLSSFSRPQRSEVKVGGATLGKSRTLHTSHIQSEDIAHIVRGAKCSHITT